MNNEVTQKINFVKFVALKGEGSANCVFFPAIFVLIENVLKLFVQVRTFRVFVLSLEIDLFAENFFNSL